jgi:hypothetical protein
MTRQTSVPIQLPEAVPMLLVDCPLCDRPAPLDGITGDLHCAACGIHLEVTDDVVQLDLPLAA